jgi:tellurite resistance protein TehA-like permease
MQLMTISIIFQAVILIQKLRFIKNKIESLNMNIKDLGVPVGYAALAAHSTKISRCLK